MIKVYLAGKIWHAAAFQELRAYMTSHMKTVSEWIDYDSLSNLVVYHKDELWKNCMRDVAASDMMLIYCGDETEEHRGVLVEAGAAMALGKPIFCINSSKTLKANSISDVAFTHHPLWNWVHVDKTLTNNVLLRGTMKALCSYNTKYGA